MKEKLGMFNPYPWNVERTYNRRIELIDKVLLVAVPVLFLISVVFSPIGTLLGVIAYLLYLKNNDSYKSRPWLLALVGVVGVVLVNIVFRVNGLVGLVTLIDVATGHGSFTVLNVLGWLFGGLFFSVLVVFPLVFLLGMGKEYKGRMYLRKGVPSRKSVKAFEVQRERFANDDLDDEVYEIGAVVDDVIPWHAHNIGKPVGTQIESFRHGVVIGSNGAGKTIALTNTAAEFSDAGYSVLFSDLKGDRKTENQLASIADRNNVPFVSFWSNNIQTGWHYDPLAGVVDSSPASILVTAFNLPVEGNAKHFTDLVEEYLTLQFEVLNKYSKLRSNESTMDWLLRTCNPIVLAEEVKVKQGTNQQVRADKEELRKRILDTKGSDLSSLRSNLSKTINLIGDKMRPSDNSIDLRKLIEQKAVIYFGLPSAGDKVAMRTVGSLLLRDVVAMMSDRQVNEDKLFTPLLFIGDELSQLGANADAMIELYQQGRSARIVTISAMQTFAALDDVFIREMLGNATMFLVMRTTDSQTVKWFSGQHTIFGETMVRSETRSVSSSSDSFGAENQEFSGLGQGRLVPDARVPLDSFALLPNRHGYIYFNNSSDQAYIGKRSRGRVRNDEVSKDIPTVEILSRAYLIEAENDASVTQGMLKRSLKPVRQGGKFVSKSGGVSLSKDEFVGVSDGSGLSDLGEAVIEGFEEEFMPVVGSSVSGGVWDGGSEVGDADTDDVVGDSSVVVESSVGSKDDGVSPSLVENTGGKVEQLWESHETSAFDGEYDVEIL